MDRLQALEKRFAGVNTRSLKDMLWQNKDNGPYDEYLQAVHDEIERRSNTFDEEEQQALMTIFQTFIQLPKAKGLCLHFYADTSGELVDLYDKKNGRPFLISQWLDLKEAAEEIQAYYVGQTQSEE